MSWLGGITSLSFEGPTSWRVLKNWAPFSFDALGLITLLGEKEVNASVGSLQRRRFSEYLPLLAAFVVAGDRFTDGQPGYALYNITDGIYTTELKYWFTRWLSLQTKINKETTTFVWKVEPDSRAFDLVADWLAPLVSFSVVILLLGTTCAMGDWFGVANFAAVLVSMLVRAFLINERRTAIDRVADHTKDASVLALPKKERAEAAAAKRNNDALAKPKTIFVTREDGRMVTIIAPLSVVKTFVMDCDPPNPTAYKYARALAWLFFGGHVCILGMSSLFSQLFTVVLLVGSTWFFCSNFDFDIGRRSDTLPKPAEDGIECKIATMRPFGSDVVVYQQDPVIMEGGWFKDRRQHAYLRPQPNEEQELMLLHWSLLPVRGVPWLQDYKHTHRPGIPAAASSPLYSQNGVWDREILDDSNWYAQYDAAKKAFVDAKKQGQPIGAIATAASGAATQGAKSRPSSGSTTGAGAQNPAQQILAPKAE